MNSFLIPPSNAGDGNIRNARNEREQTTAEEISEQIESPIRDARAGARRDAISYIVQNATSVPDDCIDVRRAINIRWNLPWTVVDAVITEAQEPAKREIERAKSERARIERQQIGFENLAALFDSLGLQIQTNADKYDLLGLTGQQIRLCAAVLADALVNEGGQ